MKKRLLATCLALTMFAFGGCAANPSSSPAPAPSGSASAPSGSAPASDTTVDLGVDEIVVGYVGTTTGPAAGLGYGVDVILKWAVDELNANGGIAGVPVRYVMRDDAGDVTRASTYARELVEREGVQFLVGPVLSNNVEAIADYLTEEKVITMLSSASATNLINPETRPYMFRTQTHNDMMAEALVRDAQRSGRERIAVVADNGTLGNDGVVSMEKYAEQYGLEIDVISQFVPNAVDMTPVAQDIVGVDADLVIGFATGSDAAKIVGALDRIGHTGKYFYLGYMGSTLANFAELAGEVPTQNVTYQGLMSVSIPEDEADNPKLGHYKAWYDLVNEEFGPAPYDWSGRTWTCIESGRAYDCLMMYKWAVETAGTLDPDVIKTTLESMTGFESVVYASPYDMGEDHEAFNVDELVNVYQGQVLYSVGELQEEAVAVRCTLFDE